LIKEKLRFDTLGLLAIAAISLLAIAGCAMASINASHGDKGSKTYPLYVNGNRVSSDSITVDGINIDITPGPAKDGNFYNGSTVTLESAQDMVWAKDCGSSYRGTACSVVMDQNRYVEVSQIPPPTPTSTPVPPTPTNTPVPPTPTPTNTPPPDDGDGGGGGGSTSPAILDPEWGEVWYAVPGQLFSRYMHIQSPSDATYFCSRTSTNYSGNYPSAPNGLTINDSCQVLWTPDNSNVGTRYEVNARADFRYSNGGSATHYVRFYVEVTNTPPPPTPTPTPVPPPDDGDNDPCTSAGNNKGIFASLLGLLGIGNDVHAQQCVPPHNPNMAFPLDGNPYTARITAVFDNDREKNQSVLAYTGDIGSGEKLCADLACTVVGYKKADGTPFNLPLLKYDDEIGSIDVNDYLFYDGHSGYDYGNPVVQDSPVYAALGGTLCLATDKTTKDGANIWRNPMQCPIIDGVLSWNQYHTAYIISPDGFSTWYVHMDNGTTEGLELTIRNQIIQNGYANVTKKRHIGYAGKKGTPHVHLHFGVRFNGTLVDPYGYGTNFQGILWDSTYDLGK